MTTPASPPTPGGQLAGNIRAELARRRIPQSKLAAAIGMDEASLSLRLQGKRPFKVPEVELIAEHLDLSIGDLWGT